MIFGTADDWLGALGADSPIEDVGIVSVADTVTTGEPCMLDTGDDVELGEIGASVAISIGDDRLKRETKLGRFDFELSARIGGCLAREALDVT